MLHMMTRMRRARRLRSIGGAARLAGIAGLVLGSMAVAGSQAASASSGTRPHAVVNPPGYRLVASDGGIFSFGDAPFKGSMGGSTLNQPIVGIATSASGEGYWEVASDGGIFSFGDAAFFGSTGAIHLNRPIVGMAATPDGQGYWLVASDGGIFAFGDAAFKGSLGSLHLNSPIVGMTATGTGNGYWLVAADGGVFTFGDATYHGSLGGTSLPAPIVGIAATPLGNGYWLAGAAGAVYAFGDAPYKGGASTSGVAGIARTADGGGYYLATAAGVVSAFGDATSSGSLSTAPTHPVVGISALGATLGGNVLTVGTFNGHAGMYTTIQAAVDAAQPGDWILVGPGDYKEQADITTPPSSSDVSLGFYGGVEVDTPDIHIRGMNRNTVVVDGTKSTAPQCSSNPADQNPGDTVGGNIIGRNGIDVWANNVTVDNLTVCNFQTATGPNTNANAGNEVWWDGGTGTGTVNYAGYEGSYLTATDTFDGTVGSNQLFGNYGIFSNSISGPAVWNQIYANNFADSGMYIGACQQVCDAWIHNAWMENNALGYSGTNSGGTLVIDHSLFDGNADGFDTNTQSAGDPPPPQNGACPKNGVSGITGTHSCWVFEHNTVFNNNSATVPGAGSVSQPTGTGMTVSGATNDTVMNNTFSYNGAWGILFVPYPDTNPGASGVCSGSGGTVVSIPGGPTVCLYDPKGDALLNNTFSNNGFYGNPSNGDYGEITFFTGEPSNCFAGNIAPDGSDPANLETTQPKCGVTTTTAVNSFGTSLFDNVLCDTGFASTFGVSCTAYTYPSPVTPATLTQPPVLPTMPNPCAGVPNSAWCSGNKPVP